MKAGERVTALGLRTRRGARLSAQTFHALLRNRLYTGRIVVPGLGVDVQGDFPPIVPTELFGRVQGLLTGKVKSTVPHLRNHPDFPLRRFVSCGNCRTPLTASWSKGRTTRYPYYHCRACKTVKVRKERLESRFVELLERLQPNPSYMRLFRAIVLDVWKGRQTEAVQARRAAQARSEALQRRLDDVDEAFIHEKRIDRESYERQRDRLREDIALAEMDCGDAKLDELDVHGVLAFAEHALTNASRLWVDASLDQKQRFQSVMFPDGLRFDGERFGTAVTCLAFSQLQENKVTENIVASPTGFDKMDRIGGRFRRVA